MANGNGSSLIPVTGLPSGDSGSDVQDLSSLVSTQTQQPQTQQPAAPATQRDLTKEPRFVVHATHYGYNGDPNSDPNSAKGIGAFNNNKLTDGVSIGLTPDLENRFGAKPGEAFVFVDKNGNQHNFVFGDRTNQNLRGRIDVYDRTGQIGDLGEGTISRPGATGPTTPALETSNEEIRKQPAAWGMRVATADDVKDFDSFKQNGGDINQIPIYDQLAVAIAKDPSFLTKTENFEAFYGLVYKPLKAQTDPNKFNEILNSIGPSLVSTAQNLGAAAWNSANAAKDEAELWYRKKMGMTHDPGYETLTSRFASEVSTENRGLTQGFSDAYNFVSGIYNGVVQTTQPLFMPFVHDAKSREELDRKYAAGMQQTVASQQMVAKLGDWYQNNAIDSYKTMGAADLADKMKTAPVNEAAVAGTAFIANPLNYIPELAAGGKFAGVLKPIYLDRILQAGEDVVGATARKTALDTTQMLPRNPELSAARPGYVEARNVQAQMAPAVRAAADDAAQKTTYLNQVLTTSGRIASDPGTATSIAGKLLQGTGAGIEALGNGARAITEFPDWFSRKVSFGNELAQKVIKNALDKGIFGWGLEHFGPVGAAAQAVLEHAPEVADAVGSIFKTMGKELPVGESTIPYWQRVYMQNKMMPKFLAQALDSPLVQTAGAMAGGAAYGAATNAVLGGLQEAGTVPGGGMQGAMMGTAQGAIIGAAGGGFGQIQRFRNPSQYLLQARGDWKRYRDMLSTNNHVPISEPAPVTAAKTPAPAPPPTHEAIQQRAYQISQQRQANGLPGSPTSDWLQAQRELTAAAAVPSPRAPTRTITLGSERQNFDQLSATNQLMLAQSSTHFPGLKVNYVNDPTGAQGFHYFDTGGRSNIQINLANQDSVIRGILAHELIHGTAHSGMLPELYDSLFGNPQTGQKGQYTAVDAQGKPIGVNPATGRYYVNQDFNNLANQYTNKMTQNGLPTAHITDFDIAKEIYAEHGADYMLSGAPILDSNSAFRPLLASKNAIKTSLIKMGYTFDEGGKMIGAPGGTIGGTGLFKDLQRNPALMNLAQTYFKTAWRDGKINNEEEVTHRFTQRDMQNPNVADTFLTNTSEIMRNPDGTAKRDPNTGLPVYRTQGEVKQYNANFAGAIRSGLEALPEDQRADLGMRTTLDEKGRPNTFMRYLPDQVLDSLAATNQYNPHQIDSLKMLSRVLADKGNPGMEMRFFYNKALTAGKKYSGFEGREKIAVPYGIELTHDNQINIKSVDFDQLANNYLRVRNREPFKTLWQSPDDFAQDSHTYFTNHKEGRPGADAIGPQKRDAINALAGFGTQMHSESNPLVESIPQSVRPIVKSYRIDRANQITATGAMRPFISEQQYFQMVRNYLPSSEVPGQNAPEAPAPEIRTVAPESRETLERKAERSPEREADINEVHEKALDFLDAAHSLVRKGRTAAISK